MSRIVVDRKLRWSLLHGQGAAPLLVSALFVVAISYGLGYHLDWSEESGRVEDEGEVVAIPAPAASNPAPAPAPEAAVPPPSAPGAGEAASIGPVPSPTLAPDPRDAAWDKMTSQLGALAAHYPGRVSIYIKDLHSGRVWMYHPDDLFPAASLIKVPVLISAFYKIKEGHLSLDEDLVLTRRNRVGGSGSLKWRPDGTRLTVRQVMIHMINESDNTATRMLLDRLGLGYVQQQFPRMGLLYTGIYADGMSIKGGRVAHENYTTAREMSMLMEKIYRGEAVDPESSALMLAILKKPKSVASRLQKGMPAGWEIGHKTGLLRQACHDSALFFTPNGDYQITVLTGDNRTYAQAKDFITKLAHVTFANYAGPSYLAQATRRRRHRR
ncbi:MAG: serine hydrolase [Elusimicrobia bacterium]|nr:serine hydrolase [Elusimicrobiota bacterium]